MVLELAWKSLMAMTAWHQCDAESARFRRLLREIFCNSSCKISLGVLAYLMACNLQHVSQAHSKRYSVRLKSGDCEGHFKTSSFFAVLEEL
jgi:hypothetical protein